MKLKKVSIKYQINDINKQLIGNIDKEKIEFTDKDSKITYYFDNKLIKEDDQSIIKMFYNINNSYMVYHLKEEEKSFKSEIEVKELVVKPNSIYILYIINDNKFKFLLNWSDVEWI